MSSPETNYSYQEEVFGNNEYSYFEGYWQSPLYFADIKAYLLKIFHHPAPNEYNAALIAHINQSNSVGIHVRRGDYLQEPEFFGICSLEYYRTALAELLKDGQKHTFFIFSNDIQWCKENMCPLMIGHEIFFVNGNKGKDSCWDMFLMSYCKDLIIANSSFSWWGAFLNRAVNRVYAPYPWLNRECKMDIYDKNWIRVSI